jgi:hypothetical protein
MARYQIGIRQSTRPKGRRKEPKLRPEGILGAYKKAMAAQLAHLPPLVLVKPGYEDRQP